MVGRAAVIPVARHAPADFREISNFFQRLKSTVESAALAARGASGIFQAAARARDSAV